MPRLATTKTLEIDGTPVKLEFWEIPTGLDDRRWSVEIRFGPEDRLVIDGGSLDEVESAARACLPASVAGRRLSRGQPGAAEHPDPD